MQKTQTQLLIYSECTLLLNRDAPSLLNACINWVPSSMLCLRQPEQEISGTVQMHIKPNKLLKTINKQTNQWTECATEFRYRSEAHLWLRYRMVDGRVAWFEGSPCWRIWSMNIVQYTSKPAHCGAVGLIPLVCEEGGYAFVSTCRCSNMLKTSSTWLLALKLKVDPRASRAGAYAPHAPLPPPAYGLGDSMQVPFLWFMSFIDKLKKLIEDLCNVGRL